MTTTHLPSPLQLVPGVPRPDADALAATADLATVEEAIGFINGLHTRAAFETACAIGSFLLDRFFGGDRTRFGEKRRHHKSYRALARHPALAVSTTYLWTSVAILEHAEVFPPELLERVPLTWHRALLALPTVAERQQLVEQVLDSGRGYTWLVACVGHRLGKGARTGRPRKASPGTLQSALATVRRDLDAAHLPLEGLRSLPPDELAKLRATAEALLDAVDLVLDRILEAGEPA